LMGSTGATGSHKQEQQHLGSGSNSIIIISSLACPAYVGQQNPLAGEYHSKDFDWHEHAQQTAQLVEQQWAAAPAAVKQAAQICADTQLPLSAVASFLKQLQQSRQQLGNSDDSRQAASHDGAFSPQQHAARLSVSALSCDQQQQDVASSAAHQPQQQQQLMPQRAEEAAPAAVPVLQAASCQQPGSSNEWEVFYRAHPSARFYKERRYLLLEFPCLAPPAQLQHIIEIGAGCGSSILPVMRAQPQAQVTVCDVSATCLEQLQGAMQLLGLEPQRCRSFVADGTDPGLAQQLACCSADVALIMFTLSAVEPAGMLVMMQNAAASLRPGGLLCIRDHALYDMVQLRIPPEQVGGGLRTTAAVTCCCCPCGSTVLLVRSTCSHLARKIAWPSFGAC
jgi:SAM-dependent methyltransferase